MSNRDRYDSVKEVGIRLRHLCAGGRGSKARWADDAKVPRMLVSQMTRGLTRRTLPKRLLDALNYYPDVYYRRKEKE